MKSHGRMSILFHDGLLTWQQVFYHIISGAKIFYFIPPTPTNLRKYEKWSSSPDQPTIFLGDEVKECYKVQITAGNTM